MRCRCFSALRFLLRFFAFFRVGVVGYCLYVFGCLGCAFCLRFRFSGVIFSMYLFVCGSFLFGGGFMIVYSEVDRLYGDCYDLRETTREIPVMLPAALVNFYYCDVRRAFGESIKHGVKNVVRIPVLIISKSKNSPRDKVTSIVASCFRVYDTEAGSCLWNYKLVPYRNQTALIKACSRTYPIYDFRRVSLCDSSFVQQYKLVYYLSGTSPKFEKKFFLLIFERRSDALKALRKTHQVFRRIFDLLGADFCFHETERIYSKIEYMYNPAALFARKLAGWRWCRDFVGALSKGVVDASEVSTEFLVGKDFEVVRWD